MVFIPAVGNRGDLLDGLPVHADTLVVQKMRMLSTVRDPRGLMAEDMSRLVTTQHNYNDDTAQAM